MKKTMIRTRYNWYAKFPERKLPERGFLKFPGRGNLSFLSMNVFKIPERRLFKFPEGGTLNFLRVEL